MDVMELKEKDVVTPLAARKPQQNMEIQDRKDIEKNEIAVADLRHL